MDRPRVSRSRVTPQWSWIAWQVAGTSMREPLVAAGQLAVRLEDGVLDGEVGRDAQRQGGLAVDFEDATASSSARSCASRLSGSCSSSVTRKSSGIVLVQGGL